MNKSREDESSVSTPGRYIECYTTQEHATSSALIDGQWSYLISDTRSSFAFAKKTITNKGTLYQIRMTPGLMCFDPLGPDSIKGYTWQAVTKRKFDYYIVYLSTKQKRYLVYANRIIGSIGGNKE